MADQAGIRLQRSRILQTENLSAARNFEHKGAISCVKNRRRGILQIENLSTAGNFEHKGAISRVNDR